METKHTQGPWNYHIHALHDPKNDEPLFTVGPREFHTVADVRAGNKEEGLPEQTLANARLIASSPTLLEALRMCRPYVAYAFYQGIQGAEEAGLFLDETISLATGSEVAE